MGPDLAARFAKKNPDLVPEGEQILGAMLVESKGGAWRRGMRAAGALTSAAASIAEKKQSDDDTSDGAASKWPASQAFWVVLTDRALHVFEGTSGSPKAGPGAAHYSFEEIAEMRYDKKLLISKLHVNFQDGSSVELDVAKQNTKPFVSAMQARFGPGQN